MGFENFGKVSFTAETKTAAFVDFLAKGKVMASKCKSCGAVHFPPKMDCPACLKSDAEWVEVENSGKLLTYSTVHYGPAGFEDDAPYTIAVAQFGSVRLFSRLSKDITNIVPDMALKVSPVVLSEERISFEFRKA